MSTDSAHRKPSTQRAYIAAGLPEVPPEAIAEAERAAVEEVVDPRGDAACPECPEGELVATAFSRLAATAYECNVCGFTS